MFDPWPTAYIMSFAKKAKEALDNGDTAACLSHCSDGLSTDPQNYHLLLLQAAAHKQDRNWRECDRSLSKAVQIQPKTAMAWQGLLQVADEVLSGKGGDRREREEWERRREECLVVLVEVAVEQKRQEFMERLLKIYVESDRHLQAAELVKVSDPERYKTILNQWEDVTIKSLVKKGKFRLGADPLPILTAKTTAKVYLESPLTGILGTEELFERLYLICTNLDSEQSATKLKELLSVCNNQRAKQLKSDFSDKPTVDCLEEGTLNSLLSQANAQRTMTAINAARERLNIIEKCFYVNLSKSKQFLNRLEGLVHCSDGRYSEAINILEQFIVDDEVREALLQAYEATEQYEKALTICKDLTMRCKLLCRLERFADVKQELQTDNHNHEQQLLLGVAEWHLNNRQAAYDHFIASAKMNPTYSTAFTWLGKYYSEQPQESERAEKCFKKALSLNSGDHEAAVGLSAFLLQRQQHMDVVQLLEAVVRDHPHHHDAWRSLGVAYFYLNSYSKASQALHLCLRRTANGRDKRILLLLGHSYAFEGRLKAAARAFQAVISETDDGECWTAKVALARVKCRLFEFDEAIAILTELTESESSTSSSVKIHNGCRLELAYCLTRAVRHSLSHFYSKASALVYVEKLAKLDIEDPYLRAESLHLQSIVGNTRVDTELIVKLLNTALEGKCDRQTKARLYAHLAKRHFDNNNNNEAALECASMACRLYPTTEHDCLYAAILQSSQPELAERHYSRAITNSPKKSITAYIYANLGFMYAASGNLLMARSAFSQARLADSDHCGEALYGEAVYGDEAVSWAVIADTARSLLVHHHSINKLLLLLEGVVDDDTLLTVKPIVDRLAGMSSEYKQLQSMINNWLFTHHTTTDPTATTTPQTLSMKRSHAQNTDTLPAFLSTHPFDLHAYKLLLSCATTTIKEKLAFVRPRLRVLEERYDGVEGTMRRCFEEVRWFEEIRRWVVENDNVE